jgi:selenocysteine-specific elongation factor
MLIVATAGHIDHGKTSIVRALTGVDTDKLPEERARGISIDLGFAYWDTEPGVLVAFVDVPGHQRFIRNMLAGVAAIDFAIIVVAVDDGPMPQTIEHLQILNYLGVHHGVIVLSKADKATAERIAQVGASMRELLKDTVLAQIPCVAVSVRTGAGVPQLKALLAERAREHERAQGEGRPLARRTRFAIDRVFTVRGAGTVVTGTVYDGQVACEDRLTVSPAGVALRVRGIQVHGRQVLRAESGERAALNVSGAYLPELSRGDWLADPAVGAPGNLMDVSLTLLPGGTMLRHASRVRLYLGASEIACRVLLRGKGQVEPGECIPARLHLEHPALAVNGDRFVLRDGPASATLGGGMVLDPCPASRRRFLGEEEFRALASGNPVSGLRVMLQAQGRCGVEFARFQRIFNLSEASRDAVLQACDAMLLGKAQPVVVARADVEALTSGAASALQQDERMSVRVNELHQAVAPGLPAEAFEFLLRAQAERVDISVAGGSVSLRHRRDTVRSSDLAAWERIRPMLSHAGLHSPDVAGLADASGIPAGRLRAILHAQARAGEVFPLQPEKYILRELVAQLAMAAAETSAQRPGGRFTAADYRDRIGTGRTLAIHVLELLDAAGVTRRSGDQRTIVRPPHTIFGPAVPFAAVRADAPAGAKPGPSRPAPRSRSAPVRR